MSKIWKKLLAVALTASISAGAAVAGTVAYLQDEDSDVNVMTLGNVDIEQTEWQRAENVAHKNTAANPATMDDLVPYVQGQALYPAVPTGNLPYTAEPHDLFYWGELTGGNGGNGLWDDAKLANVMDKFVTVTNTGKSDAYFRTIVAFECPEGYTVGDAGAGDNIGLNVNSGYTSNDNELFITVDGVRYDVRTFTYGNWNNGVLKPNETARPSLLQVVMNHEMTNKDVAKFGDTYDILVISQAVQTAGFSDAAAALNTAFGVVDATNAAEWFGGIEVPSAVVSDEASLVAALEDGGTIVLAEDIVLTGTRNIEEATTIDLNGKNLTVEVLEAKADTHISGGTLTHGKSTYPAVSVSAGTLTMDNVDIISNEYCNLVTSGTAEAAEYTGLEVWSGNCVLNDCTITVKTDKIRYSNSIFGVGIHGGSFTMNGGSITIESHGSTKPQYDYQGAIFAGSATEKVVTLNNVTITDAKKLFAWGGNTVVNTTDAEGSWAVDARNGGTYTISYK